MKVIIKLLVICIAIVAGAISFTHLMIDKGGILPYIILGAEAIILIFYVVNSFLISLGISKPKIKHLHSKIRHTKPSNKFKSIYENIFNVEANQQLEKNRKSLIKSICICIIIFSICFSIWLIVKIKFKINTKSGNIVLGFIFVPTILYFTYKYKKYNDIYINGYKERVIKEFISNVSHNLNYYANGNEQMLNYYENAEFKDKEFNNFFTDDYIEGNIDNGSFLQLTNFALRNLTEKGEFKEVIYEGIFSVTEINKKLPDKIYIRNNQHHLFSDSNEVELDSNKFEKYFSVYSNSNILVLEILTHDVMEDLVKFYEEYKIKFEIILKNNKIYIRFDTGVMFEPNILKKSNDMNTIWLYSNVINFVIDLTNEINNILNNIEI